MTPNEMLEAIQGKTLHSKTKISKDIGITKRTMARIPREQPLRSLTICKIKNYYEKVMHGT